MSNNPSLKKAASKGILWSALERFSVQGVQFIVGIVLARLLLPEDFGILGMIAIFIAISQTFVDSGLGSGLIHRQKRTNEDYSTVFVFNIGISLLTYIILFVSAPLISSFYQTPELTLITRVIGINLIINSLSLVQRTRLTIDLNFKLLAKVNVIAVVISGTIAIYFAYDGWGVWALILKQIVHAVITVLLLWIFSRWKPSLHFSKESFKNLFGYSSRLLLASLYSSAFQNIYNITIGKFYSPISLGFYTQGKTFTNISAGTITSIIQQVTFPILSSLQEDKTRMISVYRRLIKMTAFFIFPVMFFLAIIAEPFVQVVLGDKWLKTIPLLQWLCFTRVFNPLSGVNLNFLNANGRSDLFLKVDLLKAPMIIIILFITIPISVKAIVIGQVIATTLGYFFNTYYSGKLYNYGAFKQLKDITPIIITTLLASIVTYLSIMLTDNAIIKLLIGGVSMAIGYLIFSFIFKIKELGELKTLTKKLIKR